MEIVSGATKLTGLIASLGVYAGNSLSLQL